MEDTIHRRALDFGQIQRLANVELDVFEVLVRNQMLDVFEVPRDQVVERNDLITSVDQSIAEM
jgi:hypothetical protein